MLIVEAFDQVATILPFTMLGVDSDNDSAFMSQSVFDYWKGHGLEQTRSRAFKTSQLLKATIECAVQIKAVRPADLERVIVDSTMQSKAIAHPVDSRLLEIARHKR